MKSYYCRVGAICDVTLQDNLQNGAAVNDANQTDGTLAQSTKSLASNRTATYANESTNSCLMHRRKLLIDSKARAPTFQYLIARLLLSSCFSEMLACCTQWRVCPQYRYRGPQQVSVRLIRASVVWHFILLSRKRLNHMAILHSHCDEYINLEEICNTSIVKQWTKVGLKHINNNNNININNNNIVICKAHKISSNAESEASAVAIGGQHW